MQRKFSKFAPRPASAAPVVLFPFFFAFLSFLVFSRPQGHPFLPC